MTEGCQDVNGFQAFCSPVWNPCLNKIENLTLVFFCCTFFLSFKELKVLLLEHFYWSILQPHSGFLTDYKSEGSYRMEQLKCCNISNTKKFNSEQSLKNYFFIFWLTLYWMIVLGIIYDIIIVSVKSIIKYFQYKIYNKKIKWSLPTRIFLKLSIWLIRVVIDFVKYFLQLCISVTVIYNG